MSKFKTKYGYFTADGKEYVITRPDTPRPWINVISNGDYGLTFSQTGGGSSWWGNANLARLTRWVQDLVKDEWGKYLFIRDKDAKKFWSLTWKPLCPKFDFYEVRHGIGYSTVTSKINGIKTSLTIFVPPEEPLEIWKVTIKNESSKTRNLNLFSYFEWCLGSSDDTHREFQKTFIKTWFDRATNTLFAKKKKHLVPKHISTGMIEYPCGGFNSVNVKPASYEGDKERFLGMYGNFANAQAFKKDRLTNTAGEWYDPISSFQVDMKIKPKQEKVIIFTLGYQESEKKAKVLARKYHNPQAVDKALEKTKNFWEKLLSGVMVNTPDEAFNFLTNYWLKYQAISGRIWAKSAYYQSSGGYGFRDQLQDAQVFLPLRPELCKKQLLMHAEHQFVDGTVHHWWHQLSTIGAITEMTDDLLWLVYVLFSYLEETKDFKILNIKRPYLDGPPGTIYEHCCRAIDKVLSRFSKRGLPLMGAGDWNDGFNLIGIEWKGESVWLAQFLYDILLRFAAVSAKKRDKKRARRYVDKAKKLKRSVNKYCWDGKWFLAATRDDGRLIGSSKNKEGKLYLMTQAWGIFNDVATDDRKIKSIKAVEKYLWDKYGPLLIAPGFTQPDKHIGYITRYAPGTRENGSVYSHAACWAILAECYLGRGDKAYRMYSSFCPIKRGMQPDRYKAEPYVTAGNTNGPQAADYGAAGWTWYSGSGAWLYRVCTNWMLGIRPTYKGLLIEPSIPKKWSGFSVRRIYGNAIYNIEVKNPNHVSKGVKEVYLDGKKQDSNVIKDLGDNKTHNIEVIMK
ncbi:MAG: glycosyl transferase family 36 [Candidatus Omnitrophota bacterium]|nr:MAG: glycosyl transferase family 36 [Candidatus Omnitrophota bacterium]